jgi:hypothetical protein
MHVGRSGTLEAGTAAAVRSKGEVGGKSQL